MAFYVVAVRTAWCKIGKAVVAPGIQLQYVIDGIGIGFAAVCTVRLVG